MLKEIKILTIFPKFFDQFSEYGVVGKAIKSKKINFGTFVIAIAFLIIFVEII